MISRYFPAWYAGLNPDHEITIASYQQQLAEGFSKFAKQVLVDLGPTVGVCPRASASVEEWDINPGKNRGILRAVGIQTGVTGRGADCLIIDDPVKDAADSLSPTVRQKTWDWYLAAARTRLSPDGIVIIVCTRWHFDDLAGRVMKSFKDGEGEPFQVLSLPAICDSPNDPINREIGEALWPERWPVSKLRVIEKGLGPYWWNALYQQRPTLKGGGIFMRPWFKLWTKKLPDFEVIIQSWDTAYTEKTENNPSAYTVWGVFFHDRLNRYCAMLLYAEKGYWTYSNLRKQVKREYENGRYGANEKGTDFVVIENQGSGKVLITDLQDLGVPVRVYNPGKATKIQRAHAVSPLVSGGLVYIPESDTTYGAIPDWAEGFLDEVCAFPMGAQDDFTDTMTQALYLLRDMKQVSLEADPGVEDDVPEPAEEYVNPYAA